MTLWVWPALVWKQKARPVFAPPSRAIWMKRFSLPRPICMRADRLMAGVRCQRQMLSFVFGLEGGAAFFVVGLFAFAVHTVGGFLVGFLAGII